MKTLLTPAAILIVLLGCATTQPKPDFIDGWKTVPFGASEAELKQAWAGQSLLDSAEDHFTCHLLKPPVSAEHPGIAFILENGKFVRYEVSDTAYRAPGGVGVGSKVEDVQHAFGNTLTRQPDKYDPQIYQLLAAPNSQGTSLIFIFDQSDRVIRWRAGIPPAVFYVENCG